MYCHLDSPLNGRPSMATEIILPGRTISENANYQIKSYQIKLYFPNCALQYIDNCTQSYVSRCRSAGGDGGDGSRRSRRGDDRGLNHNAGVRCGPPLLSPTDLYYRPAVVLANFTHIQYSQTRAFCFDLIIIDVFVIVSRLFVFSYFSHILLRVIFHFLLPISLLLIPSNYLSSQLPPEDCQQLTTSYSLINKHVYNVIVLTVE